MLTGIRLGLVCVGISVAAIGASQGSARESDVALENDNVKVIVELPRKPIPNLIADCGSVTGNPFVRIFVPTNPVDPTPAHPRGSGVDSIFADYIPRERIYGCNGTEKGTRFDVHLISPPHKSTFRQDAVRIDPTHNEVLLENDRVRVVRIHFAPGDVGPMVDKRPRVIVAVTDSHATVTFPDGHSEPREMKAGTVSFGNAGRQATKNSGTTSLENIVVELKGK